MEKLEDLQVGDIIRVNFAHDFLRGRIVAKRNGRLYVKTRISTFVLNDARDWYFVKRPKCFFL